MQSLFDAADESRRDRLRALGWQEVPKLGGVRRWKRPDGATVDEDEAFRQVEQTENPIAAT